MKISCNRLKKYIKNSDDINFNTIWDTFSIRTAEVEGLEFKGQDLKDVVSVEVVECEKHETKKNYSITKVYDGANYYSILCGAPNVKKGMKSFLVKVGGMISGFEITEKKIAGVLSEGMLCSGFELGINQDKDGIVELPEDTEIGKDIKELYEVEDIIVEIDNKSLTNRPDLWGHYGIAREISAITKKELLPLKIEEIKNNLEDFSIEIKNTNFCNRFCGIKIDNVTEKNSSLDLQIFLNYVGLRPISLLVDLTNYVMLELGQPMHAYDSRLVPSFIIDTNKNESEFTTLDNKSRKINETTLMIQNDKDNIGIAGIMGGLDSEVRDDTTSIVLESANFSSVNVRKTSSNIGLRTDASTRFEKGLDPNICDVAIKRFVKLLKSEDENIKIASNLTDVYSNVQVKNKVSLLKDKLFKYLGKEITDDEIITILKALDFEVNINERVIDVIVPTNRSTKDIYLDVDIIEEISRMYGYENLKEKPLLLENTLISLDNSFETEYDVKNFITTKYKAYEVHSYLWYDSQFLKEINVSVDNISVVNKKENNVLRDDLSLSLLPFIKKNFKNFKDFIIYEIGTVIVNNENRRRLSILIADDLDSLEENYFKGKEIILNLFSSIKNQKVSFKNGDNKDYYVDGYTQNIIVDNKILGTINILDPKVTYKLGSQKSVVTLEVDFDEFLILEKIEVEKKEVSNYQPVELDFTISTTPEIKYEQIKKKIDQFKNHLMDSYKLVNVYKNNYTIKFILISHKKTLDNSEISAFKNSFISYINEDNMIINEN